MLVNNVITKQQIGVLKGNILKHNIKADFFFVNCVGVSNKIGKPKSSPKSKSQIQSSQERDWDWT